MSEPSEPTAAALIDRLDAAIRARPKYAALPIDIEDVRAVLALLRASVDDTARLDHLHMLLANADGQHSVRVTNEGAARGALSTSYYLQRYGSSSASLRDVVDADRVRLETLTAHRATRGAA